MTASEWKQVLDSHRGAVLVVYVWGGWCRPCVEALPEVADLQKTYGGWGRRFASLSLEDEKDKKAVEETQSRLRAVGMSGRHYLLGVDFAEALEILDVRRVPAILVYERGERVAALSGNVDERIFPEDLTSMLDAMLVE